MIKKIFDWIIDKWLASLLTGTLFFFAKIYYELPATEKANFFDFSWLTSILTYKISVWQVGLLSVFFILVILFKKTKVIRMSPKTKEVFDQQTGEDYREDVFGTDKAVWTWSNKWDSIRQMLNISDAVPKCPSCNHSMKIHNFARNMAVCTNCKLENKQFEYSLKQLPSEVIEVVINRLGNGDWANANYRLIEKEHPDVFKISKK